MGRNSLPPKTPLKNKTLKTKIFYLLVETILLKNKESEETQNFLTKSLVITKKNF